MKKMFSFFGSAALFLSVSFVQAEHNRVDSDYRYTIEGVYGRSFQENSLAGSQTLSDYAESSGVRGAVLITDHLAFEVSYIDYGFGETLYEDDFGDLIANTLDTQSVNIGLQGTLPLNHIVSLTGRVGVSMWELDFSEADSAFPGDVYRDSDQGADVYVGVGLQMNLENNFRLSIEYTELEFSPALGTVNTDHRVENVSLSAGVSF